MKGYSGKGIAQRASAFASGYISDQLSLQDAHDTVREFSDDVAHPETTNSLPRPPDLLAINLVQLLLQVFPIGLPTIEFERPASLRPIAHRLV